MPRQFQPPPKFNYAIARAKPPATAVTGDGLAAALSTVAGFSAGPAIWSATDKNAHVVVSNGSLTVTTDNTSGLTFSGRGDSGTTQIGTNKRHFEIHIDAVSNQSLGVGGVGIAGVDFTFNDDDYIGGVSGSLGYYQDGNVVFNNAVIATLATYTAGDTITIECDGSKVWFAKNAGGFNNDILANQNPATGVGGFSITSITAPIYPAYSIVNSGTKDQFTANFGATAFARTPSSGYAGFDTFTAVPGAGASAGLSTVSGVGATTAAPGVGTAAALSTPSGAGAELAVASGAAAGTSTVLGVGVDIAAGTGASAGTSTVLGIGAPLGTGAGASAAVSTVAGVGLETAASTGTAAALATNTAAGAENSAATGQATGTSTTLGQAPATGLAASVSTATGVGRETAVASGAAAATSTPAGIAVGSFVGLAASTSTVLGVGRETAASAGLATGTATDTGTGSATETPGVGASAAVSTPLGVSRETAAGAGLATATSTVAGSSSTLSTGLAAGLSTVAGISQFLEASPGAAFGASSAPAVGRSTAAGTGAATGTGTATALSLITRTGDGLAAAIGTATGTGATLQIRSGAGLAAASSTVSGAGRRAAVGVGLAAAQSGAGGIGASLTPPKPITYPLAPPPAFIPQRVMVRAKNTVGFAMSAFSGGQQVQEFYAQWWEGEITLPPMSSRDGAAVAAWLEALHGQVGTFEFGNPKHAKPKGAAKNFHPGTFPVADLGDGVYIAGDQLGYTLPIRTQFADVPGYLLAGDQVALGEIGADFQRTLHRVIRDVDLFGGRATLDLWPRLSKDLADGDAVYVLNPTGLFRLATDVVQNDVDESGFYYFDKIPIVQLVTNARRGSVVVPPKVRVGVGRAGETGAAVAIGAGIETARASGAALSRSTTTANAPQSNVGAGLAAAHATAQAAGFAPVATANGLAAATSTVAGAGVAGQPTIRTGAGASAAVSSVSGDGRRTASAPGLAAAASTVTGATNQAKVGAGTAAAASAVVGRGIPTGNINMDISSQDLFTLSVDGVQWAPSDGKATGVATARSTVAGAARGTVSTTGLATARATDVGAGTTTGGGGTPQPPTPIVNVQPGDSRATIQSRLNSVGAGGSLVFPSGTFDFGGGTVTGRSNITLWSNGPTVINNASSGRPGAFDFGNQSNWTVRGASPGHGFVFNSTNIEAEGASNGTVGNCEFNNCQNPGDSAACVGATASTNMLYINNDFNNCGDCLGRYGVDSQVVDGCHFVDCHSAIQWVPSTNRQDQGRNCVIIRNVMTGYRYGGIEIAGGSPGYLTDLIVDNNWFSDQGPQNQGAAINAFSCVTVNQFRTKVRNNVFIAPVSDWFYIEPVELNCAVSEAPEVNNNIFSGEAHHIDVPIHCYGNGANNMSVHNNQYFNCGNNIPNISTNDTTLGSAPHPPQPQRIPW